MAKKKDTEEDGSDKDRLQEDFEKAFGEGSISKLGQGLADSKVNYCVSSRSMVIDKVILGGRRASSMLGIPAGRITELSGPPGSGKTTLCSQLAAEMQSMDGKVVVIDTEARWEEDYVRSLGVDTNQVYSIHADSIEDVFDKQIKLIKSHMKSYPNEPMLMVWDSVGATPSRLLVESEDPMSESSMAKNVRVISHGIQVIAQLIAKSKVTYVVTNHVYTNIGGYGEKFLSPGGLKLQFHSTIRLRLMPSGQLTEEDDHGNKQIVGQKVRISALKNSMAPKRLTLEACIRDGEGFSDAFTIFDLGADYGVLSKSGAWASWQTSDGEIVKFQGWDGFKEKVMTHPKYPELVKEMFEKL
jgi:recombination protein RecA